MKRIIALLLLLLFICVGTTTSFAQFSSPQIDSIMNDALTKFKVAGASIALVKDRKVIHQKGYGVTSVDTKRPLNEYTNFQIASNTKAFTTAALSILVDEKKLNWTDRVKDYLPAFKMYNDYVTENFNIKDLITIFIAEKKHKKTVTSLPSAGRQPPAVGMVVNALWHGV